jgi:sigma-B regulation protein RsbU (phosphoserine phosphatase)
MIQGPPPEAPPKAERKDAPPRPRVLVLDDSLTQRTLMARALTAAGYDVTAAADPARALELARDPSIRIVVSDWRMPGMDGPEFCRRFRRMRGEDHAYIVLVTADGHRDTKVKGLDSGADDFVTRPVDWIELRARLRAGERMLEVQAGMQRRTREARDALAQLRRIHIEIERDLEDARSIQRAMLPPRVLRTEGALVALRLETSGKIGGDLVGYFPLNDHEIALYAIDVSGHGIASALVTGRLAGLLSSRVPGQNVAFTTWPTGISMAAAPDAVMHKLNALMLPELQGEIYFTALLAYVDLRSGRVRFCQAGHPHPLIRRADGRVERLGAGGPPVGLLEEAEFEMGEARLAPGDLLLACSDGLMEAEGAEGALFGEEGVARALAAADPRDGAAVLGELGAAVSDHAAGRGPGDDLSMIMLRFDRAAASARLLSGGPEGAAGGGVAGSAVRAGAAAAVAPGGRR